MALQPVPRNPPTPVTGVRTTGSVTTQRIKQAIRDKIIRYEPLSAPLTLLTGMVKNDQRTVGRSDFDWMEEDPYPREVEVEGAQTAGDTAIEVVAGQGTRMAGTYVYKNRRTREVIRVASVATDTATVRRGIGGFSDAMVDGDILELIGTAAEEGADVGTIKTVVEARVFNYTQTHRLPWGLTGRQLKAMLWGGSDWDTTKQQMMIRFKEDQERTAFFGARDSFTGVTNNVTMTGGLEFFIKSNVFSFAATPVNDASLVEAFEYAFRYGAGGAVGGSTLTKYGFFSRRWISQLELAAKERIQVMQDSRLEKEFGLKLTKYVSTHGTLVLVPMNIFQGEHQRYGFVVDLNHMNRVVFNGRDMQVEDERQSPGVDGRIDEILCDAGWEIPLEAAHSIFLLPSA